VLDDLAPTKQKILDAALTVIRTKGYAGTTVDDLCKAAEVTKGALFHHFASKEDAAVNAAHYWSATTSAFFADAPYHRAQSARDRLLAYVAFRKGLLDRPVADFTCLVGTMVQETFETHPAIREACAASITGHAATLVADIEGAIEECGLAPDWSAESLGLYIQGTMQGAFILAKATGGNAVAERCFDHLRRHLELLFPVSLHGAIQ